MAGATITIGGTVIAPGERRGLSLPVGMLHTHVPVDMPVWVINGRRPGPRLFISAAIHGDELNGIEIIRRIRARPLAGLRGTLLLVPVVNVFGLLHHARYLPDRRDLNRSFPGSERGSLAARLAHQFMTEIVARCTHGIDLHTGAIHRSNLPQVRAQLDDPETRRLALAFGAPVVLDSRLRDGSLREAAAERGIPTLIYEAGEALRFDEMSIRIGVAGIIEVMRKLEMLRAKRKPTRPVKPVVADSSYWVRAPEGGILRTTVRLGQRVSAGETLGQVSDPFGAHDIPVSAVHAGIVIGCNSLPLVNEGDALIHVARMERPGEAYATVEAISEPFRDPPANGGVITS
ncbi:succinylglutamate desuccinylase/aspartoacylase family protein [Wenzhouxiangella sp. XN24]|uniref:succinylglutamate desuccinylase/aspartoacylase family protein n=1 Tax=Wenzhouxiangella sp. XN24 TaxID=2713569 RepID=UPI0013EDF075|nr:succinylglutamate desuccinylase/aspartoacylase family protein [Wenzhouxiangella sp. XN24]NGX15742.1 succinylglutamate desuccinylase/aspartoacylase family protein [Wenzhouxiangella sp. XN24]